MQAQMMLRAATAVAAVSALLGATAATASAKPSPPPSSTLAFDLPAGLACAFPLRVELTPAPEPPREFTDKNGNVVRLMTTGRGADVTYENTAKGTTFSTKANGSNSVAHIDPVTGAQTVRATGHNGIILFPSDIPAGPTTTLYIGSVEYSIAPDGVWTLGKTSGQAIDICAKLA